MFPYRTPIGWYYAERLRLSTFMCIGMEISINVSPSQINSQSGTYPPVAYGVLRDLPNRLRRASQWEGG